MSFVTLPPSLRGVPIWLTYLAALVGVVYMLNPGAGFIEAIPDNMPIVGNLDEGVAFTLIWYGLVEIFQGRKYRRAEDE
ncbi:MAG: DUF1232 domain-containing protein [Chloroflexi bacterium]|nr:DUF1232 domain-containing protein [Chloroflexota bacterium]